MALNGIDISNWQPDIDLSKVASDFVIVKTTEGTDYVSPVADTQIQQAFKLNKLVGVYHYATGAGAVTEANFFLSNIKGYMGKALLVLDFEGEAIAGGPTYAKTFLDTVYQATGIRPLLYTSKSVVNQYDWSAVSNEYDLWGAQYASTAHTGYQSEPWEDGTAWGSFGKPVIRQYTGYGRLAGYAGDLDLDLFYGDKDDWQSYVMSDDDDDNTEPEPSTKTPIVQYSDAKGQRAYAYTHWQAVTGKPDVAVKSDLTKYQQKTDPFVLTSPNGTQYQLAVDDKGVLSALEVKNA